MRRHNVVLGNGSFQPHLIQDIPFNLSCHFIYIVFMFLDILLANKRHAYNRWEFVPEHKLKRNISLPECIVPREDAVLSFSEDNLSVF